MITGECARTVLHVDNTQTGANDGNDCLSRQMPCLTLAGALAKTVTGTRYVAMHASPMDYTPTAEALVNNGARTYIVGIPDPADPVLRVAIDRISGNGPILRVTDNASDLTIINLTLKGAAGSGDGDGVVCVSDARLTVIDSVLEGNARYGIMVAACDVVVDRTIIRANAKGAGDIDGSFSITNSFIVDNVGTNFGGLQIANLDPTDVLAHNTFAQNRANAGMPGSLDCDGTGVARNNIMFGSAFTTVEVAGTCAHQYSLIGTSMVPGMGNFTTTTIDTLRFDLAATPANYHIGAGSVALGRGGPGDAVGRLMADIDRQPRPATMADVGADELP